MLHNYMLIHILYYVTFLCLCKSAYRKKVDGNKIGGRSSDHSEALRARSCWLQMDTKTHMQYMSELDEKYAEALNTFRNAILKDNIQFNKQVLDDIIQSRGKTNNRDPYNIPSGLNLGGYSMIRMPESILFFHRMKLRNDTHFRINQLETDLYHMRVMASLSLNDLHLIGSYKRSLTDKQDPSILYYTPTYGQVEILLKNVEYMIEGRLRLIGDRPYLVLMSSDLDFADALMIYNNNATHAAQPTPLSKNNIAEFMDRIKSDLDQWLRDYLNEHFIFFNRVGEIMGKELREYHNLRNAELNRHVQASLATLKNKLMEINATAVKLPNFSIYSANGVELKLLNGALRGLDSMHQASMATGGIEGNIRKIDVTVAFSNLRAVYQYTAFLPTGMPPLNGQMILCADQLTARMSMSLLDDPENIDLEFDIILQIQPQSLTVDGPANRMIANFKHLLEYHIISIMTNAINHNIRSLGSLVKCRPKYFPFNEPEKRGHKKK